MELSVYKQFAEIEKTNWWFVARRQIMARLLTYFIGKDKKVPLLLDVGCGPGINAPMLRQFTDKLELLEASEEAIKIAKEIDPHVCIMKGVLPGVSLEKKYDVVTLFDVLEHIEDSNASLLAIKDILKPGGMLIISVPAFMFLWSEHDEIVHHKRRYTKKGLNQDLINAGFVPLYSTYANFFIFPFVAIVRLVKKISKKKTGKNDFFPIPKFINAFLRIVFASERFLFPFFSLPFGVSIIGVYKKNEK
jgi:SAM-dependent methyltransferase